MSKNKKKGRNPLAVICSTLGTLALVVLIAACVPLTIPRMLGYELYTVVSGSMEPAIPTGSLVYVENMDPTEVQEGDVIAFYSVQGGSAVITHRVVTNSTVMGEFITKGDANEENDMSPIPYYYFIGRVVKSIPRVGSMAQTFTSSTGKLAAASLMGLGVILHLLAAVLNRKREKEA
ncbi:MAG: signal peptidase I [Anaerosacchariphilus sp.]